MGEFEIGRCNFFADLILTFNSGVCFQNGLLLLINYIISFIEFILPVEVCKNISLELLKVKNAN